MSNTKITKTVEELIELKNNLGWIDVKPKDELSLCAGDLFEALEKKLKKHDKESEKASRPFYAVDKDNDTFIATEKGAAKIQASKSQEHSDKLNELLQKEIEISTFKVTRPLAKRILELSVNIHKLYNGILWDLDLKKLYSQDNEKDASTSSATIEPEGQKAPVEAKLEKVGNDPND